MNAPARRHDIDTRAPDDHPIRLAAAPGETPGFPKADAPSSASAKSNSPLVLRVLTGLQKGAQARMRHQRLLVGNLQSECDVVLDIGSPLPHTCLVRASRDGWTVLSIAGDLWLGTRLLAPNEAQAIASGDVLTLGDVAFCIADPRNTDLSQVQAPSVLPTRGAAQPHGNRAAQAAGIQGAQGSKGGRGSKGGQANGNSLARFKYKFRISPRGPAEKPSGHGPAIGWAGIALLLVLAVAVGSGVYVASASSHSSAVAASASNTLEAARATLASFPWATELTAQIDPLHPRRVLLAGYLPRREQAQDLDRALRSQGLQAESRWVAVDELLLDLSQRLNLATEHLRYDSRGVFDVRATSSQMLTLDRAIRRVLQDSPAVNGFLVRLTDKPAVEPSGAASHATVRYHRAPDQPGGVAVTGLEHLQPPPKLQRYVVRELRLGRLPSVVLDNGARYFEGSVLPGGATLTQISAQQIQVQLGAQTLGLPLEANVQVAGKAQSATAKGPGP